MKRFLLTAGLFLVAGICHATDIGYSGPFVGKEGVASVAGATSAQNYTRDMNTTGDRVSFQITYSSYAATSSTFSAANYVLNTPTITINSNNFITGLQVLYSTGSVAISGLTNQTTYYISVISSNTFKLSSSLANAQAGTGIVLASSSTTSNVYTLAPLAFTGGGIQLQWSDDGKTFSNATTGNYGATISSVSFVAAGGTTMYDLGPIQYRYLRMIETAPTAGAVNYTATDNERYSYQH
jgi:hypothetical protein